MNTITYRHYYTVSGKCLVRNYPDSMLKRNLHTSGASHDLEPTVCITVSRRGECFWDGRRCGTISVTKCEKDGKAYAERVPESERGFKHLTERENMVVSRDSHHLLR